ncbi:MAG: hypothetical protein AB7L13_21545 [Acidimicrobiia bacterium]
MGDETIVLTDDRGTELRKSPGGPTEQSEGLVLDDLSEKLEAFRVLRRSDGAAADALLEQIGGKGKVEEEIVLQLGAGHPLWRPDRFAQAHRLVMRALEVLDRNGARAAKLPKMGPLQPVAQYFVQMFTRLIVRSYVAKVMDSLRHLYGRREANCIWGSEEMHLLRRARIHAEHLTPGFKRKGGLGLPTFLVGGAAISTVVSLLKGVSDAASKQKPVLVTVAIVVCLLFLGLAWCILRAAATARHRIRLTTQGPLQALWETIGAAGNPPKDDSRNFALYALLLTAVGWLVLPIALIVLLVR